MYSIEEIKKGLTHPRFSDEIVRRAYEEILPSVEHLLFELMGKTVVTADHGQMIGERLSPIPIREYGHPAGIYTDELVNVPWHVFDDGPRREIVAEEPATNSVQDDAKATVARERLRDLG